MEGFSMRYQSETPVIEAVKYICPRYNTTRDRIEDCFNEFPDWLRDAFNLGRTSARLMKLDKNRDIMGV